MNKKTYFKKMHPQTPSLFSLKEQYLMGRTARGQNLCFAQLPQSVRRELRTDNLHLMAGMRFTEANGFPVLRQYNGEIDFQLYSYKDRRKHKHGKWAVHFFQPDSTYCKAVTTGIETTTFVLRECDAVFAPDFSLYVDAPEFVNKQNIFRSRFAAAWWQSCGYNVIQTASWGNANSLKYCFEGLAEHSVTAVCGIGHDHRRGARLLWEYAVRRLIEEKSPTTLIIYGGNAETLPELGVPVKHYPDFITTNLRTIQK